MLEEDKKMAYFLLNEALTCWKGGEWFPSQREWFGTSVPTKISSFAWEAWWGKVMTLDQIKRRGFNLANRCPLTPLCGKDEENVASRNSLFYCLELVGLCFGSHGYLLAAPFIG